MRNTCARSNTNTSLSHPQQSSDKAPDQFYKNTFLFPRLKLLQQVNRSGSCLGNPLWYLHCGRERPESPVPPHPTGSSFTASARKTSSAGFTGSCHSHSTECQKFHPHPIPAYTSELGFFKQPCFTVLLRLTATTHYTAGTQNIPVVLFCMCVNGSKLPMQSTPSQKDEQPTLQLKKK